MTDMKQLEKSLERWRRKLPWDRIVKSEEEAKQIMKDCDYLTDLCAATMLLAEKQERELEAFRQSGADAMETHGDK